MSLNIKLLLDKRRARQDGKYPLIMRLLLDRKSINISLGYSLLENEWDEKNEKIRSKAKLGENVTRLNNVIHKKRTEAYDFFTTLQDSGEINSLSLKDIKARITGKPQKEQSPSKQTVFEFIDQLIEEMVQARKQGNAAVYKTLKNKLKTFSKKSALLFEDIDYTFLRKLETAHFKGGGDLGGLSVYMRTLRAVYNKAIKSGLVSKQHYPFDDYKIKNKKPVHKALSDDEFAKLVAYQPIPGTPEYRDKNLFLASFYLRGMNWMDMAYAKVKDISAEFDRLNYVRRKTGEPFSVKVHLKLKGNNR